jgi:serine/threonine-protein kinase
VGKLALPDAVSIISQAAHALGRAAAAGIVHRDLKPSNIFIVKDGDDEIVKILDFGIAKTQRASRVELDDTTRTGTLIGSPRYMSPEQARSSRVLDHRSDLWSLAVIAYRAITGRLPFTGDDVADLLVKICAEPATPPSQIDPALGPEIDAFFTKALARLPDERFQTARELSTAFAQAAGEDPPPSVTSTRLSLVAVLTAAVPPPPAAPAAAPPPPSPARVVPEIDATRPSSQPASRREGPGDRATTRNESVTAPEPFSRRRGATSDAAQTPANGSIDVPARSGQRPARRTPRRRTTLAWFVVAGALAAVVLNHSPRRIPASHAPAPAAEAVVPLAATAVAPAPAAEAVVPLAATAAPLAAPAPPVPPVPAADVVKDAPRASAAPASPTARASGTPAQRRPVKPAGTTKKQNPVLGI